MREKIIIAAFCVFLGMVGAATLDYFGLSRKSVQLDSCKEQLGAWGHTFIEDE